MDIRCPNCFEKKENTYFKCSCCGYSEARYIPLPLYIKPGTVLAGRYHVGKVLGNGGFGVTYLAWDEVLSVKIALKEYLPNEYSTRIAGENKLTIYEGENREKFNKGLKNLQKEAKILETFNGEEGVVSVYDSFVENNTGYIVMEYIDGESLKNHMERVNKLEPKKALGMLLPIIKSMEIVNRAGVVHRDISPDNIMITKDGHAKLIDFGSARYETINTGNSITIMIKHGYSPEEQYRKRTVQGAFTDVYAIAAVLYRIITGIVPPDALERRDYLVTAKKDKLIPPSMINKKLDKNIEKAILHAM